MTTEHRESTHTLDELFDLMEAIRAEVHQVSERQEALGTQISEIAKHVRRIELRVGTANEDLVEIRGHLRGHEARLQNLGQ
jgi:chromosome segregation ATPase